MKQKLLDDLIAFLKASPDPGSSSWCDEGDRLLKELQAAREALVYKPCTKYRLERHYMAAHTEYVNGKFETTQKPYKSNLPSCPSTPDLKLMQKRVRQEMTKYPLEELRLHYGSRRIKDIESWLEEVE